MKLMLTMLAVVAIIAIAVWYGRERSTVEHQHMVNRIQAENLSARLRSIQEAYDRKKDEIDAAARKRQGELEVARAMDAAEKRRDLEQIRQQEISALQNIRQQKQ